MLLHEDEMQVAQIDASFGRADIEFGCRENKG
jgi:hypothetical protein